MQISIDKNNKYDFITISNSVLEVVFCPFGASIYSLKAFNHHFLLSPDSKDIFLSSKGFYGKALGPIAGRYIESDYYQDKKDIILHGGKHALSFQLFDYKIKQDGITFFLTLKDNDSFIGNNAQYEIDYTLKDNRLLISHKIIALEDTYASMSTHAYFVGDEKDCRDAKLKLKSESVSIIDNCFLIQGLAKDKAYLNFDELKIIKDELMDKSPLLERGHHYHNVTYPIIISDSQYEIQISSDYPDALITIDQLPVGEICLGRKEEKYSALVIEPEIMPNRKDELFIPRGKSRVHQIKYSFFKK